MHRTTCGRIGIPAAALLAWIALSTPASFAAIRAVTASGHIDFSSGYPPFNAPFGFVTTGTQRIPPGPFGGLFLQRWHLSPLGYAEGGTGMRIITAPLAYYFNVPTNSYLFQRRNTCPVGAPPAQLFEHFDAVLKLDGGGFPAHIATVSYPVVGRNAPGRGSFSVFWARLHFGTRTGDGQPITQLGTGIISYFDFRPGAAFAVRPTAFVAVPAIPAGNQLLAWGDILFRTRGCPPGALRANGIEVSAQAAPGNESDVGSNDDSPLPAQDPGIVEEAITDPQNVFMDMPLPNLPSDGGTGTSLSQVDEDPSGATNEAPVISPIPDQVGAEGQLLTFQVGASDPDGDQLSYSLGNAPGGMSINSTGLVSWVPPLGSSGVYQVTVKVTDQHGALSQTVSQALNVAVNGVNHAPTLQVGDSYVPKGSSLVMPLQASDPDPGQTLTFSLQSTPPAGASLSSSGVLSWTPAQNQGPRDYLFTVRVTDNGTPPLWAQKSFTVHVQDTPGSPQVQSIPPLMAHVNQLLQYQVVATDSYTRPSPDPSGYHVALTYQLAGNPPAGAAIDPQSGLFTWTPAGNQVGQWSFGVMVTDETGAVGGQQITVTVVAGGARPMGGMLQPGRQ